MALKPTVKNRRLTSKAFGKIGVLMGGPSSEREISLRSGKAVYEALQQRGLSAFAIEIQTDDWAENIRLLKSKRINCAFIALHGRFGEDGQVQQILESLDIPYTCSGVAASKLAMDKIASRQIFASHSLKVPVYKVLNRAQKNWQPDKTLVFPLVVKPAQHGSSIGLSIVDKKEDFSRSLAAAFEFDERAIVEEYLEGRELTVGILDAQALSPIEIIPKKRFFDYEAKYQPGMTDYIVPAQLEGSTAKKIQGAALFAHKLLGCAGCSRVDIILKGGFPYILELNCIPGLTATSLLPKAAKLAGIEFPDLCLKLIELAYAKK